jgi:ribosomal protein L11 methyltransferase
VPDLGNVLWVLLMTKSTPGAPAEGPGPAWLAVSVQIPPAGETHLLVEALRSKGGQGLERVPTGARIRAYFPERASPERLIEELKAAVRAATSLRDPWLVWERVAEADLQSQWARNLERRIISSGIRIIPSDSPAPTSPDSHGEDGEVHDAGEGIAIHLHPGPSFGEGRHPTTRLALRLLEDAVQRDSSVLDVGTGSGILAIAAAHLGARQVEAVEGAPRAAAHARNNVDLNRLQGRIRVRTAWASPATLARMGPYDGATANLEPPILLPLLPSLVARIRAGGWVILTGVPRGERLALLRQVSALHLHLEGEAREGGWWAGHFLKSG